MLIRRILRIGNSLGVSLPAKEVASIGVKEGTPVEVDIDPVRQLITLRPVQNTGNVDPVFIKEAKEFAERNRQVLEELARR